MEVSGSEAQRLLRRPLYLFDLPQELLLSLSLRTSDLSSREVSVSIASDNDLATSSETADGTAGSSACALCQAVFRSVVEQRQHVKSDFHRYNLKLKLKGSAPVEETTFTRLVGELDESISGSESSNSEEDEVDRAKTGESTLTALLRRQARLAQQDNNNDLCSTNRNPGAGKPPLLWMSSSKLPGNISLGVYRAVLSDCEQEEAQEHLIDVIRRKQLQPVHAKHSGSKEANGIATTHAASPHILLCMIGGGHFAAMVVSLVPEIRRGPGGVEERHAIVEAHKTIHRYTTRRGQGGSQSANDNAKGNAHSAGSSIRRYNEAALEIDVRNVLAEWKIMIDSAALLFIRASGTTNRRTLFGPYDGQVIHSTDKRIRGFPFTTRRATQAELMRSFSELTRLKVSSITESALESTSKDDKTTSKAVSSLRPETPKPSKEEEAGLLHTLQLQALIRRSKAPGVMLYLTKNELTGNYLFHPPLENYHAPTPLHLAASLNSFALILALLTKANADPTILNGDGKTAFDIAGDTKTRDAFRIARHSLGETAFDWRAAHVPSPLSQAEADSKQQRDRAAIDAAEAYRRKVEVQKLKKQEEEEKLTTIQKKAGSGRHLGTLEKTGTEKREEESRGMTPEMRVRMERERRARAAEERIRKMQGGR